MDWIEIDKIFVNLYTWRSRFHGFTHTVLEKDKRS